MAIRVTPRRRLGVRRLPRRRRSAEREGFAASLFLMPSLLGFVIFTAFPVLAAIGLAFYDYDLLLGREFNGLDNFRDLLHDDVFRAALLNTLYFTAAFVPLSVALGLGAALLVNRGLRGITLFRTIFLLPYVTVTVAVALVWRWIYRPEVGLMNTVLGWVGIDGPSWLTSRTWAMPGLIIMSVWKHFGYNMVIFLAGLTAIPQHLYDAAKVDGANAWQRFVHITLPMLSPTTLFVMVISIISSFQVFDQALVMTNGGPGTSTTTLVLDIYKAGFQSYKMGYASAIALVLFVIVAIVTAIQFWLQRRWVYEGEARR
jgi:multiple sugar transport system permease protein